MSAAAPTPVYLDCDTGIDDALALAYLIAHPGVELVGVGTVSGNVAAAQAAANTLGLLAAAGVHDVPVAVGAHDFSDRPFDGGAPHVHGDDGVGGVAGLLPEPWRAVEGESAAELLLRLSRRHEGELRVLAIGPFTNLAMALRADPGLAARVHSVTLMGGAIDAPGNVSAVAEANVHNDAIAAHEVFAAPLPIVFAPLDVTMSHTFDESHRQRILAASGALPRLLGAMLEQYFDFYEPRYGSRRCALHDPLAAALVTGEVRAGAVHAGPFSVVVGGAEHGRTVPADGHGGSGGATGRTASTRGVLSTDDAVAELLLARILGPQPPRS